ncbi:MAG: hypothetical protein NVSMB57_15820 [Actinomycetota bacterium]
MAEAHGHEDAKGEARLEDGLEDGHEDGHEDQGLGDEGLVAGTLAYLARALVGHPDDVSVTVEPGHPRTVVRLIVHPDDLARVIGRGGRVARSIRALTKAAAARADVMVHVQIGEPRAEAPAVTPAEDA